MLSSKWVVNDIVRKQFYFGQWLWHSWQRGPFQYQRSRVRIQSPATFIEQLFTVYRKDEKTILLSAQLQATYKNLRRHRLLNPEKLIGTFTMLKASVI